MLNNTSTHPTRNRKVIQVEIVELNEEFPLTLVERSTDRPHVGEIIHDMLIDLGIGKRFNTDNPYQFEKGFMWERLLSMALPIRVERPGEIVLDGIILTPDGVGFNNQIQESVVEEYKCTARSSNGNPADNVGWMMQVKAYCWALGLRHAIMRALYLAGNYGNERSPIPKTYLITFTGEELELNWRAIVMYAKSRGLV